MVFNTQLNSLHKNGETCHRMRAPEKVIINDIRTRRKIRKTQYQEDEKIKGGRQELTVTNKG